MPEPTIKWTLFTDEKNHTLDSLMANLIHHYMPELVGFSSHTDTQGYTTYYSTTNYRDAPVKPRIDAAIEDYMRHLSLATQSRLRETWEHAYDPYAFGWMANRCKQSSIPCRLMNLSDQHGHTLSEVRLDIPLALMFTLLWQAIHDKSAWSVPEGSTAEIQEALRIARFDWINQLYFFTPVSGWFQQWPYPWLQLLDGYQGKTLQMTHSSKSRSIDAFLSLERQEQMVMLERIYDETWEPDNPGTWANIFIDYWINTIASNIDIILPRLFSLLAMLHYRAETHPSKVLIQILNQIHSKIQVSDTTLDTSSASPSSSTNTCEQLVRPAGQASELAQRLATKSLFPEYSSLIVEYVAHSPRMPTHAIAWLLSQEHGFNTSAKKKTQGRDQAETPLELACELGHPALVQHLLNINTSESAVELRLSAIKFAVYHRDITILNLLLDDYPLPIQTTHNYEQYLALACEQALSEAANRGHIDVLRRLLQHIPKLTTPSFAYYDERHCGPLLFWAVVYGHTDIVQSLLNKGADMHSVTLDKACLTALSACAIWGRVDSLRLMLDYANTHGQMPDAHYIKILISQAISRKQPAIVSLLIEQNLFVLSPESPPAIGQIQYPESCERKFPYGSDYRDISGVTAHQSIVNLAPTLYQPIVRRLIEYIMTRDVLPPQRIADHLAEKEILGYPKTVKLHVAHQLVAAMLSDNPQAILNRLSDNEQNALQQGKLGKIYQTYQQAQASTTSFSQSQQLWRATVDEEESQTPVSAHGCSSSTSASTDFGC